MFGDLGGDFCKKKYEPKLFGMHIGSVLSGLHAENMNTDPEMSILLMFEVGKVCVWRVENEVFSKFGGLGGTFIRTHVSQNCLGCIL